MQKFARASNPPPPVPLATPVTMTIFPPLTSRPQRMQACNHMCLQTSSTNSPYCQAHHHAAFLTNSLSLRLLDFPHSTHSQGHFQELADCMMGPGPEVTVSHLSLPTFLEKKIRKRIIAGGGHHLARSHLQPLLGLFFHNHSRKSHFL